MELVCLWLVLFKLSGYCCLCLSSLALCWLLEFPSVKIISVTCSDGNCRCSMEVCFYAESYRSADVKLHL